MTTTTRRSFLASSSAAALTAQTRRPPNVLIVLSDDQGWGDFSLHGNTNLSTPNIDGIARDGAQFDRFFVCPVCAPTRAEFLTGRYHARGGVRGVSTGQERLNLDEYTIAQAFRTAGYRTGIFGKWHNGSQPPYHPNYRGFDEFYGFTSGHWGHYFDTEMDHNGRRTRGKGYIIDDLTDRAMAWVEANRSQPFFCYVPYNSPHSPMQVPDRFYGKFAKADVRLRGTNPDRENIAHTRAALAMCENVDWNTGRLLTRLRELNLDTNTIVLYFCDNGPNGNRWNGGMKGTKGSIDEGGIRSPLLVRWPGQIRPGTRVDRIAGAIDLLPTLTNLCGVSLSAPKPLDGRNLSPLLLGRKTEWPDRKIFSLRARRVSVRTQQYRLDVDGRLYDMQADPEQRRDVTEANPKVAAELSAAAAAFAAEVAPNTGPDDRPFLVGHAADTWLPARDGTATGGVARSNTAPNSSYFTRWTTPEGRIQWDVEVLTAADYEITIYYACPAADTGSTIEASFVGKTVKGKVAEANDPPLVGGAEDRVDRGPESYVKNFKPLRLGTLRLDKKRGPLTLRALEVPGKQVAEVRYLHLRRQVS